MKDEHHEKMSAEFGKLFSGVEKLKGQRDGRP
jgi:hypothetical protein